MANKTVVIRGIISLTLILAFFASFITGMGLFFAPTGKIAKEFGWTFLGLDIWQLEQIHTLSSFLMTAIVVIHFFINYKMFISELKMLFRRRLHP